MIFGTQMMPQQMMQMANMVTNNVMNKITAVGFQILMIVGFWILYESRGEKGWKAIIPVYSTYIAYKLFFKKSKFWALVIFTAFIIVGFIMLGTVGLLTYGGEPVTDPMGIAAIIGYVLVLVGAIAFLVISIQFDISICKKYNMGLLFTLGMIFATPIFLCALAYEVRSGKVTYQE